LSSTKERREVRKAKEKRKMEIMREINAVLNHKEKNNQKNLCIYVNKII
jgi:hypothetical protein